jgi:cell division septum initiation protein DivIVA
VSVSEVNAFEPQSSTEPTLDMPQFAVVRRGLDRQQVEAWGKQLAGQIQQEQGRADHAEQALYRAQQEARKTTPSFTHLGSHAAGIIEEAGRSAEQMLLDAAERAQETTDAAEADAAEIITAAEDRPGEIRSPARQDAEELRAEGARVAEETRQAAEAFHAQTEEKAHSLLAEAREATEALWQQAERERLAVEGETRRLEGLRQRTLEQLGRMYGHLESVLEEVRLGIGGAQEVDDGANPDPAEATLPAAAEGKSAAPSGSQQTTQPLGATAAAHRRD